MNRMSRDNGLGKSFLYIFNYLQYILIHIKQNETVNT